MKEFKYCHEEITMGVEIPVTVCETQKEMVAELIMQKDCFDFAADRMNAVEEKRVKGYFNIGDGTLDQYAYREACNEAISGTDEEMMYIIYKDGSKYWNGAGEVEGKFKRYGIKRAIISAPWGYTVFGDFAINDMGDVTIEESEIEEYGVYAGQYDVKEQDEQEVQETVEQTETKTNETTVETTTEQETVEGISKAETATAESGTEVEQNVETAEQIQAYEQKTEFKKEVITMINTIERISYNMTEREKLDAELKAAEAELKAFSAKVDDILAEIADEEYDAAEAELTAQEDILRDKRSKCWLRAFAAQFPKTRNEWFTDVVGKLAEEGKADGEEHHITAKQYDCFSRFCKNDKDTWRDQKTYCRVENYFVTLTLLKYGKGQGTIKIADLT